MKVEVSEKGENIRFVVTNIKLSRKAYIYETIYCGRGQMENYIKDHKLCLHGCNRSIPGILWLKSPFPKLSLCWKTELYFLKQEVSYHGDFEDILKMSR